MLLENLNIIGRNDSTKIKIVQDKIERISSNEESVSDDLRMEFDSVIAFPGLINSHDHLEFNLFPKLGNKAYESYLEWGADIHQQNKSIIDTITKIPKEIRVQWGVYKNLLNGITTVVQHGEYFKLKNSPINIFQNSHSLHSVRLEKNWKRKLNNPFAKKTPFVIHLGEGTNAAAFEEIDEFIRWNFFRRKTIAVHGVAMNLEQAKSFAALVWCPDSNYFLLNQTAKVNELKKETEILFGTDSTVSAGWNIWEQIRLARKTNMLSDDELFNSLNSLPAAIWGINDRGMLAEGKKADIIIAKMKDKNNLPNSFFSLNPEDILLLIANGEIILFDESLFLQIKKNTDFKDFKKVFLNNTGKFVKGNLPELIQQIKKYSMEVKFPVEIE